MDVDWCNSDSRSVTGLRLHGFSRETYFTVGYIKTQVTELCQRQIYPLIYMERGFFRPVIIQLFVWHLHWLNGESIAKWKNCQSEGFESLQGFC